MFSFHVDVINRWKCVFVWKSPSLLKIPSEHVSLVCSNISIRLIIPCLWYLYTKLVVSWHLFPCGAFLYEMHNANQHWRDMMRPDERLPPASIYLYRVLLQVEVTRVDWYALGHLLQVLPGADDSAGLVGAGAQGGAGGGGSHQLRPREEEPQ